MQYGNYVAAGRNDIQKAKDEMLEDLIGTIRELAKRDDFWIVKRCDPANPLDDILIVGGNDCTVGWKIDIPHMGKGERKPIQVIVDGEVVGEIGKE